MKTTTIITMKPSQIAAIARQKSSARSRLIEAAAAAEIIPGEATSRVYVMATRNGLSDRSANTIVAELEKMGVDAAGSEITITFADRRGLTRAPGSKVWHAWG